MFNMKTVRTACGTFAAVALLTTGAAQATPGGGGDWGYGHGAFDVWSNYLHPSTGHASSVTVEGTVYRSNGGRLHGCWEAFLRQPLCGLDEHRGGVLPARLTPLPMCRAH